MPDPNRYMVIGPSSVRRVCVKCRRQTLHEREYDAAWGRVTVRCGECHTLNDDALTANGHGPSAPSGG